MFNRPYMAINFQHMKKTVIFLFLALVSLGAMANGPVDKNLQTLPTFKDAKVGEAVGHYLALKDALVASKTDVAKKASADLTKTLAAITTAKKAGAEAAKVAAAPSIAEQRKAFTALSTEMTTLAKESELTDGSLYLQFCPMANNNSGGSWLAVEKDIKNPYFGDMMLKCGSVKETIE